MPSWPPDFDDPLVVAITAALAGAILTKLLPALWSVAKRLVILLGRLLGGRFAFGSFKRRYLNWVVTEYRELRLTGIASTDDLKKPKLDQVFLSLALTSEAATSSAEVAPYIPPDLLSVSELRRLLELQRRHIGLSDTIKQDLHTLSLGSVELKRLRRQLKSNRLLRVFRPKLPQVDERSLAQDWLTRFGTSVRRAIEDSQLGYLLNTHRTVAILGSPGAGKTTLLQFVALAFARAKAGDRQLVDKGETQKRLAITKWRLPVFVRLSSVASLLVESKTTARDTSILDILPRLLPPDLQTDQIGVRYLTQQVRKGHCVFLFDGLDEVPGEPEFQAVVRALQSIVINYPGNTYIISSRVAGWRGGISGSFTLFYVRDLSDSQINDFVDTWYTAVEQNAVVGRLSDESDSDRVARERRARQRSSDLRLTLRENVGIRRLATNPMLLSIIALVHRSLATLPKERAKLYAECSKILLEQWDISRGVRVDDTNLRLEQKEAIMRRVALAFHTGEIGDAGGGREADRTDVVKVMAELLPGMGRLATDADRLLSRLIERSGIIVERRRGTVSFAHHTFQEYFAAQSLAMGARDDRSFLLAAMRLGAEWWHEVVLLYAGLLAESGWFVEAIVSVDDGDLFLRRRQLAGLCTGEAIEIKADELRASVVQELLKVREGSARVRLAGRCLPEVEAYLIRWAKSPLWVENAPLVRVEESGASDFLGLQTKISQGLVSTETRLRKGAIKAAEVLRTTHAEIVATIANLLNSTDAGEVRLAASYLSTLPDDKLPTDLNVEALGHSLSMVVEFAPISVDLSIAEVSLLLRRLDDGRMVEWVRSMDPDLLLAARTLLPLRDLDSQYRVVDQLTRDSYIWPLLTSYHSHYPSTGRFQRLQPPGRSELSFEEWPYGDFDASAREA